MMKKCSALTINVFSAKTIKIQKNAKKVTRKYIKSYKLKSYKKI